MTCAYCERRNICTFYDNAPPKVLANKHSNPQVGNLYVTEEGRFHPKQFMCIALNQRECNGNPANNGENR